MKSMNQVFGLLLAFLLVFSGILYPVQPAKAQSGFQAMMYPTLVKNSSIYQFSVPLIQDLKGGDWFKITFPESFDMPSPTREYKQNDEIVPVEIILLSQITLNLIQAKACIDKLYINYKENSFTFFLMKETTIVFEKNHSLLLSFGSAYLSSTYYAGVRMDQYSNPFPISTKPGIYTFRFLATGFPSDLESTPVTIDSTSDLINNLQVQVDPHEFNRYAEYRISFTTGPSNTIKANQTWIYVDLISGSIQHFSLPNETSDRIKINPYMARYIFINGQNVNQIRSDAYVIIQSPVNIGPNEKVTITFSKEFGLQNPKIPGNYTIKCGQWINEMAGSVPSNPFTILPGKAVINPKKGFSFLLCLGENEEINPGDYFYILLPDNAELYSTDPKALSINGNIPRDISKTNQTLKIECGQYIMPKSVIQIDFLYLRWKVVPDEYVFGYKLNEGNAWIYTESSASNHYVASKFDTFNEKCYANQLMKATFRFAIQNPSYLQTNDSVIIEFPKDMQLPDKIDENYINLGSNFYKKQSSIVKGNILSIVVTAFGNLADNMSINLTISQEAGIRFPRIGNRWIDIYLSTTKVQKFSTIATFLNPEMAVSTIDNRSAVTGQKSWLTTPPELVINTSVANRFLQINNHVYSTPIDPIQLPSGQYSLNLGFYTLEEMQQEKANSVLYQVDTVKPLLTMANPHLDTVYTKSNAMTIKGKINLTTTVWNIGYYSQSQNTIDQEIKINGQTVFFEPKDGTFQYNVPLKKGLTPVKIEVEDWAGNRTEKTLTIAFKTGVLLKIGSKTMINGDKEIKMDVPPVLSSGRTFIPLRYVGDAWGIKFQTKSNAKKEIVQIKLTWESHWIEINLSAKTATKDGKAVLLDAPPYILSGRLMVPLRFVSEQIGKQVTWDPPDQTILIL